MGKGCYNPPPPNLCRKTTWNHNGPKSIVCMCVCVHTHVHIHAYTQVCTNNLSLWFQSQEFCFIGIPVVLWPLMLLPSLILWMELAWGAEPYFLQGGNHAEDLCTVLWFELWGCTEWCCILAITCFGFSIFFAPSSLTYFIFSSKPDAPLDWTQPELLI